MKSEKQINDARAVLRKRLLTPGLSDVQKTLLGGMLNALVWAADGPASTTIERLLSDEPMAPGQDHTEAFQRLNRGLNEIRGGSGPEPPKPAHQDAPGSTIASPDLS